MSKLPNFGHRTTNSVEQFFRTVKTLVTPKMNVVAFVRDLLTVVDSIQNERRVKHVYKTVTVPTVEMKVPDGFSTQYMHVLTERAQRVVITQMNMSTGVKIVDADTVLSRGKPIKPGPPSSKGVIFHILINFYGTYERGLVIIDTTMACDLSF